jgi:hypothetical protein
MHRLSKTKLLRYKRRLEADSRAFGLVCRAYRLPPDGMFPASSSLFARRKTDEQMKQILVRQLAQLYEYENVVNRLNELE